MDGTGQQPQRPSPLQARWASRASVHRPAFQPPQPLAAPAAPLYEAEEGEDDDGPTGSSSPHGGGLGQQPPRSASPARARPAMMLPIIHESMGGSMADQSSSSLGAGGSISESFLLH